MADPIDNRNKEDIDEKLKALENEPADPPNPAPDNDPNPDNPDDADPDDNEDEDDPAPTPNPTPTPDPDDQDEPDEDEDPDPDKPPAQPPKKDDETKKFKGLYKESTREALILNEKNKKFVNTFKEAQNIPEPTEEELRAYATQKGAKYDDLDPFNRNILKDNYMNSLRFNKIGEVVESSKKLDEWEQKVDTFIGNPQTVITYPQLDGLEKDFAVFAMKPTHIGVDMEVLVRSFSFGLKTAKKKRNNSIFNRGGGGQPPADPAKKFLDENDAKFLRENNPRQYARLVKDGKIKIEI